MTEYYVVSTGCPARIKLAVLASEREAYQLANALDGVVDHIPYYKTYQAARQDSNIAYEMERTRGHG